MTYLPGTYSDAKLDNVRFGMLGLSFTAIEELMWVLSSPDRAKAKDLPLAKLHILFTHVKVELAWQTFSAKFRTQHECRQALSHVTTGPVPQLPESNESVFMEQMSMLSETETKAQEKHPGLWSDIPARWTAGVFGSCPIRFLRPSSSADQAFKARN